MQILTGCNVNILDLKMHPRKIKNKPLGCMPVLPGHHAAALAQLARDTRMRSWELAFQARCPSLYFSNDCKHSVTVGPINNVTGRPAVARSNDIDNFILGPSNTT